MAGILVAVNIFVSVIAFALIAGIALQSRHVTHKKLAGAMLIVTLLFGIHEALEIAEYERLNYAIIALVISIFFGVTLYLFSKAGRQRR